MLVCTECGTVIERAGQACPACGHRGAIEQRFYHGEVRRPPEEAGPTEPEPTSQASATGALPDAERAWSPWLAALFTVALGPAAGGVVATWNLHRFRRQAGDPWVSTLWILVVQLVVAGLAGWAARLNGTVAWLILALLVLVVAVGLTRWQWEPVLKQRRTHPGNHSPGTDAFGVVLLAVAVGLVAGYLTIWVGDRVSGGAFGLAIGAILSPVNG